MQVGRSFLLSVRNVRWPRRMLSLGAPRALLRLDDTDKRTDARPFYITLIARSGQRYKRQRTYEGIDTKHNVGLTQ